MDKKGFTLIEMLIVVAIIGILAAISVPLYTGQQKAARRTEAYTNLQNLRLLEEQYFAENSAYAVGNGVSAIQAVLPGFKPGSGLNYSYKVTAVAGKSLPTSVPIPYDNSTHDLTPNTTPCFIATASGSGKVAGDIFAIDCNNNRNF